MNVPKETTADLTTKLLASVMTDDLSKSLVLILSGANVNGTDKDGFTPLHLVRRWYFVGANFSQAIKNGQYLQAQLCITNGGSVNTKAGTDKATPLHIAAENLDPLAVSQLISGGSADPEEKVVGTFIPSLTCYRMEKAKQRSR